MSLSSCEEFMQEYKKGEFLEVPINTIDLREQRLLNRF